jgi:hypothetical protein
VTVDTFAYSVSRDHGYTLHSGASQAYVSAWQGLIDIDRTAGAVLRIRMECTGIPRGFPVHRLTIQMDYAPAKIGDRDYLLPYNFQLEQEADGGFTKNHAVFRSYQKFEASSTFMPEQP